MAKTKSRTTAAKDTNPKKFRIIAGVFLMAVVIVLIVISASAWHNNGANAYAQNTFYVDVNGTRYYKDSAITLKHSSITTFKCGYVGKAQSEDKLYSVKITSTSTEQTEFTYTLDGAKRKFLNGEDYTSCFDISESSSTFTISHVKDTPETVLQRRYPGRTVTAPETDPKISYFTLTVSSADNSQSISFALTFGDLILELDPSEGIVF